MTPSSTTDDTTRIPGSRAAAIWGAIATVMVTVSVLGVFLVAPQDADQGIIQRIFYFHVAITIASLVAFAVACVAGIFYLRTRNVRWDDVGEASIRIGMLFSVLVVITGSIWAKASWGTWWVWSDPRLVTYLIVVLIYAAYFVLRSSAEDDRKMRFSAIYAIAGFASVPLSFYSVRVAESFVHPVVFTGSGANMPGSMLIWFVMSQLAMIALFIALLEVDLLGRRSERALRRLAVRLESA
jgi:heme exporter protein C